MMKSLLIVLAAASAVFVQSSATDSTSAAAPFPTADISECIYTCATQALAVSGCQSITDLSCLCVSTTFQSTVLACLQANCTSSELPSAIGLQSAECASVSGASIIASVLSAETAGFSAVSGAGSASGSNPFTSPPSSNTAASTSASRSSSPARSSASTSAPANSSSAAGKAVTVFTGFGTIAFAVVGMVAGAVVVL